MPITHEVVRLLIEGEKEGRTTTRVAKDIALGLLRHFMARLDLELESLANTAVAIDFDGSLKELDRYRAGIRRTRERLKKWAVHEAELLEEDL